VKEEGERWFWQPALSSLQRSSKQNIRQDGSLATGRHLLRPFHHKRRSAVGTSFPQSILPSFPTNNLPLSSYADDLRQVHIALFHSRFSKTMSFQDSSALESQPTTWRREDDPQYSDDPEFRHFTQDLSDRLFSLTSNISRLSSQVALLGTKRETERVRERVRDLIDETSASFKDIGEGLKKVSTWHDLGVRILSLYLWN